MGEHILKYKSIKPIIDAVKRKIGQGVPQLEPLEKRLKEIEKERKWLMDLYRRELMEINEVEQELAGLNNTKNEVYDNINEMGAHQGVMNVDDETIRNVIATLGEQVQNADPQIRKRAVLNLFKELRIGPKTGSPWVRKITAKGVYLPLTAVSVASPRGFEPLLPA